MKYSGIDLHSNNCFVVVSDGEDRVVVSKRVKNELPQILAMLAAHREEIAGVVVESTYNWYWLVDGLQDAGYTVHLANTHAIKKYDGLKHSGDEADARYLAHLLRLGLLPTGTILPRADRALRDLARKRMQLVRSRTQHILALQNISARQFGAPFASNQIKCMTSEHIEALDLCADIRMALNANLAIIKSLSAQITLLEARLAEALKVEDSYARLKSIPGVGVTLATVIALETGPISRFAAAGHYASYARCVGTEYVSNGKKKGEGNRKNGNKYLSWAFVEAAHFALRYNEPAKRYYERKRSKTNVAVATKALAHKLARAVFHMLKEGKDFDPQRCFA